jgi:hypothetical protein
MALLLAVKWVRKSEHSDPCQRIQAIGGNSGNMKWRHTQEQAIEAIEKKVFQYFIKQGSDIQKLEIGVTPKGLKFLKTQADIDQSMGLIRLPDIPE